MEKKKNIWVGKIVVIVLIIVSIGSYYVFPSVKHVMNQVFKMFASGDFAVVRDFVASYGAYAALISFLLIFLSKGASEIASAYSLNDYAASIIEGIILFFILGSEFFINYKMIFRGSKKEVH